MHGVAPCRRPQRVLDSHFAVDFRDLYAREADLSNDRRIVVENAIYPDLGEVSRTCDRVGSAPSTAAQAAKIILDGVKAGATKSKTRLTPSQ